MSLFLTSILALLLSGWGNGSLLNGPLLPLLPLLPLPTPPAPVLTYSSYLVGPICTPAEAIRTPSTVNDIVSIVQEAIGTNRTVKAFGHRHSATDIICTNGIPVDMRRFQDMQFNATDNTVTIGAGVYLRALGNFLLSHGRGLRTTPGFGQITIGGAIGTGAHGSSIKYNSSISEQVVGVTIVNGYGNIQTITNANDLDAFRIHLGLLGIIVNVKLDTVPLYKVQGYNYIVPDTILTNGQVIDIARNSDQISLYWFPSSNDVVVANWSIVDVNTPGEAYTFDHVPSTTAEANFASRQLGELAQAINALDTLNILQDLAKESLVRQVPEFVPIYTEDGINVLNPAVGYYDVMFAPICNSTGILQCPWFHGPDNVTILDNEMAIDLEDLPAFITVAKQIMVQSPAVFPLFGILLRFSGSSNTYMSTSYGADTVHIEWYTLKRLNPYETASSCLSAYQAMMQTMQNTFNGRSHWGKSGLHYISKNVLAQKLNPAATQAFVAKMQQYDPNGVFMNDFGLRLKGIGSKINTDPLTTHCALLDNCICSKNTDCALGQVCTQLNGFNVCQTPNLLPVLPLNPNPPLPTVSVIDWMLTAFNLLG